MGASVTIDESGTAYIETGSHAGDGIVNQGNISQTASGGYLVVAGNSFTNSGTITAGSRDGTLTIEPDTFTNSGTLTISNGDAVGIEPTNFSNAATGVIAVRAEFVAGSGAGRLMEQSGLDHARQRFFAVFRRQFHARRLGKCDQFGRHGLH